VKEDIVGAKDCPGAPDMNGRRIKELFFVIDTCLLNLRQRSQAVNQLEK
jgi:hypothetical protein